VPTAYLVLFAANLIYATAPTVARLALQEVGPATLAFTALVIGALILVPLAIARGGAVAPVSAADRWSIL